MHRPKLSPIWDNSSLYRLLRLSERMQASGDVQRLVTSVLEQGHALTEDEVVQLFEARGADFHYVCQAADLLRQRTCGDK